MPHTDAHGLVQGSVPTAIKDLGMNYLAAFSSKLGVVATDYHHASTYIDDDVSSRGHAWKYEVRFETKDGCDPVKTHCSIEIDIGCTAEDYSKWPLLEVEHRVTKDDIPPLVANYVNEALAEHGLTIDDCGGYEFSHNVEDNMVFKTQWENESCHHGHGSPPVDVEVSQEIGSTAWTTQTEKEDKSHVYA